MLTSGPGPFPQGKNPGAHWIEGWVVRRDRVNGFGEDKLYFHSRDSNHGPSSPLLFAKNKKCVAVAFNPWKAVPLPPHETDW